MNILSNIVSESLGTIVENVGDAIDKLVTSDEEKLAMKNELVKIQLQHSLEMKNNTKELEKEITSRWVNDNEHLITRMVRPLVIISMFTLFIFIVLCDGNIGNFVINERYIPVLEGILNTVVIAYFSGRSLEKSVKIHRDIKKEKYNGYKT